MPETPQASTESRDASPRAILWFGGGLVLMLVAAFVAIHFLQNALEPKAPMAAPAPVIFGSPPLQTNPVEDLARFREEQEAKLHSYGWVNRRQGIIRIPIERAMALMAERGLPTRAPGNGGKP